MAKTNARRPHRELLERLAEAQGPSSSSCGSSTPPARSRTPPKIAKVRK
jgi:hypothetical protein